MRCADHVIILVVFLRPKSTGTASATNSEAAPFLLCRVGQYSEGEQVGSAKEFAGRVFTTAYMGTQNSSAETRRRAATLAAEVGAHHLDLNIDTVVAALTALFAAVTGRTPAFKVRSVCAASLVMKALTRSRSPASEASVCICDTSTGIQEARAQSCHK